MFQHSRQVIKMFGKKKPEDLTHDELKKIADRILDYDSIQRTITDGITDLLYSEQCQEKISSRITACVGDGGIKQRVHNIMNSDAMSKLIYDHLKTKISAILTETHLIDEIVQERVDAAGIDQVIQWNNVAYGMLLSRLEDIEKESKPNAEIIKGLFGK